MLSPAYKESVRVDRIKKFDNELFFFNGNQNKPFAYRSADGDGATVLETVYTAPSSVFGAFSLCRDGDRLCCTYDGANKITALISGAEAWTENVIEEYLRRAYALDPYAVSARAAFEGYEELATRAADFCGCLTDVMHDGTAADYFPLYGASIENANCEQIAITLPIVALMFRRLSALRGFNFKVTVKDSLPCLIFSARALLGEICAPSDIPEYSALTDIFGNDGLVIGVKLKKLDEYTESGETVHKLSLAICPQSFDPRGILRAPAWRQRVKDLIEDLDIDLDGKY